MNEKSSLTIDDAQAENMQQLLDNFNQIQKDILQ